MPAGTAQINLLDYKYRAGRESKGRLLEWLLYLFILLIIIAAAVGIHMNQKSRLAALQEQNQLFTQQRQEVAAPKGSTAGRGLSAADSERQKALDQLRAKQTTYVEPLQELYREALLYVDLNKVSLKSGELAVNGYSDGQEKFIDFAGVLLQQAGVNGVASVNTQLNDKTNEATFNLVLDWEVKK